MTVCYNYRCRLSGFNDVYMFSSMIVAHGLHRLDEAQWKGRLRLSFMFKIVIT